MYLSIAIRESGNGSGVGCILERYPCFTAAIRSHHSLQAMSCCNWLAWERACSELFGVAQRMLATVHEGMWTVVVRAKYLIVRRLAEYLDPATRRNVGRPDTFREAQIEQEARKESFD
jgi:hypothetical protein